MAKKLFVNANTEEGLNNSIAAGNLNAEVAFIREPGKEGIYAKGKTYQTIPSNGKNSQILVASGGKGVWADIDIINIVSYGVEWDINVSDPVLTRVGNMSYHRSLPIQSGMKGCIYKPMTSTLAYWLNERDWRFRKDPLMAEVDMSASTINPIFTDTSIISSLAVGQFVKAGNYIGEITGIDGNNITVGWGSSRALNDLSSITQLEIGSRLDGYDGEVMVYVPSFYIRSWIEGNKRTVRISSTKVDDTWEYQPAVFLGAYKDAILRIVPENMGYLSTLQVESVVSISNKSTYCRGGDNSTNYDDATDSFKGTLGKCVTSIGRNLFRPLARQVGKEIMSYRQYKNILYWLWVIEYANFNSQDTFKSELTTEGFHQGGLGRGICGISAGTWNNYNNSNPLCPNGYTNEIGNGTGIKSITVADSTVFATRWRGIENLFGDVAQCVDGIIIDANTDNHPNNMEYVYTTDDPAKYGDTLTNITNMKLSGLCMHESTYIKEWDLGNTAEIIPREPSYLNKNHYKCDYHASSGTSSNTLKLLLVGGYAHYSEQIGIGWSSSSNNVNAYYNNVGYRTCCIAEK